MQLAEKSMAWPGWGHALEWLPLWNTIVLLSSSVTVHFAHIGLKNGDRKKFNRFLGITVGLALIFVGLQAAEYYEAYAHYGLTLKLRYLWLNIFYAYRLPWLPCNDGWIYACSYVG